MKQKRLCQIKLLSISQSPLHTFPRNFPVDGEVADVLRTC